MLGDWAAAETYSTKAMTLAEARLQVVGPTDTQSALQALGAAIEVKAAVIEHRDGRKAAAGYLTGQLNSFSSFDPAFRSRLYKRRNQLELVGSKAPAIRLEDYTGATAPSLPVKNQSPSVLFLWAEWCGDCRAQAAALRAAHDRFAAKGVRFVGLTRYYKEANAAEKQRVEQAWAQHYPGLASVPTVISTESMVRYGGSSTPTFVFLRADGTVTAYLPSRLTEQRLAAEIEKILP
jgi:thiol-disulfide isomerase/thioredoxin